VLSGLKELLFGLTYFILANNLLCYQSFGSGEGNGDLLISHLEIESFFNASKLLVDELLHFFRDFVLLLI